MNKKLQLKITLAAIMAALSIVLEKVSIPLGSGAYKITFYGFPLLFTSTLYGPFIGLLSGIVVGTVSQMTSPYGLSPTTPLWMLAPILWGTIGGLLLKLLSKFKGEAYKKINIVIVVVVTSLLVSLINSLVSFLDAFIMEYTFEQTFVNVVIRCSISLGLCVPYSIMLYYLCNRLKHLSWQNKESF